MIPYAEQIAIVILIISTGCHSCHFFHLCRIFFQ